MAWLIDPIIIILLVVITQSGHMPTALKVILCIALACVGTERLFHQSPRKNRINWRR